MFESTVESSIETVTALTEKAVIHILHVDDEASFLKAAKQFLQMQGAFQVDTASSVEEAWEQMKDKTFDVIVSDHVMPGKNGLEFLKELRKGGNNIPFIIFTGKGREEVAIKALNLGADGYINKAGPPETVYGELAHSILQAVRMKPVEEELRKSEEKYRKLMEDAPIGLCNVDLKGKILYINKRLEEVSGYSREEIVDKNGFKLGLFSDETVKLFAKRMKDRLMGKPPRPVDFQVKCKDGRWIWVHSDAKLIKKRGVPVGFQLALRDITERKKFEDALRMSEERYRNIIELAPDGIITVDLKGMITSVNPAFLRFTGYTREEIVGKHFTKLQTIRPRDIPKYLKLMGPTLRGKKLPSPFEYPYVCKDGTIRWGEAHTGRLKRNGKTIGFQAILREITERKQAEKAVRESQQKFRQLFMDSPEAAVYVDPDFHVLNINPRFTQLLGWSLNEIKGKHIDDVVVPEDKREEAEMLNSKAKEGYIYHDTVRKRKDGTLVPVSISAAPIIIADRAIGHMAMYKDLSELKTTEKALRETMIRLAMINEKLDVIGKMVRHDVRNKLSTVTTNAHLLKKKLTGDREALQHLSDIQSAVTQTTEIFDFARTYEKLGVEELEYMDVAESVEEAIHMFSNLPPEVKNECDGLTVMADSLLTRLFYNLIHNSLEHGGKVNQITVYHEEEEKEELRLIYEDDGVGIPDGEKEKIFREGYGKGSGYGLYLIRKMCEVYGWTIRETGKHGEGAQFVITIPKKRLKQVWIDHSG